MPRIRSCLLLLLALGAIACPVIADARPVCTAVAAAATGKVLKQQGYCARRVTPASTFKLAISLMGYDSGFLVDEHSPALPFREGYAAWNPTWKATTDPTRWMRDSVVWFSQQATQALGEERFHRYVTAFQYGNEDVSGDPGALNGLTQAWLSSSLRISPLEQLAFLGKVVTRRLGVSAHAYDMTSRITALGVLPNGWKVHGKTGTGFPLDAAGRPDQGHALGWFVGWANKNGRTFVFARLTQDEERESVAAGLRTRDEFLAELPALLDSL
jgi:beta-lactamase class D/beta-lactamase class D OXA-42